MKIIRANSPTDPSSCAASKPRLTWSPVSNTRTSCRCTTSGGSPVAPAWCFGTFAEAARGPSHLRRGRLARGMTTMVDQIGSALATSHAAGVVHRDVKPANVFLDETGNFYLGDFGIALEAAEPRRPDGRVVCRITGLRLPETITPTRPSAHQRTCMASVSPSTRPRPAACRSPTRRLRPSCCTASYMTSFPPSGSRRPQLPDAVDEVLARATAKDPAERYQTVADLVAAFHRATSARQCRTRGPPRDRHRRLVRRSQESVQGAAGVHRSRCP